MLCGVRQECKQELYEDRIRSAELRKKIISAEAAASLIKSGMTIGASGFGNIGYPKAVPLAIASQKNAHGLSLICGASTGDEMDGALAGAGLLARRYAFQSQVELRRGINSGNIMFGDVHLSRVSQMMRAGDLGKVDAAILECCLINEDGSFVPTLSVGIANALAECADMVLLELNLLHPPHLAGLHDISSLEDSTKRIIGPDERIGMAAIPLTPKKIAAIVITDKPDQHISFSAPDENSKAIAALIIDFLRNEAAQSRLPDGFCIQSGFGSVANAVLDGLRESPLRGLSMFTEVLQDGALDLLEDGVLRTASATSLCLSAEGESRFYRKYSFFKDKIVLRPQEISNCDTLIRRFGIVGMNNAVEADIYGNINSTHVLGTNIINGIGGAADFARNAALSIFITPSVAKNGSISCIVPMATHIDVSEHDVQILVTEQGLADLRGLSPKERAERIIQNCCHPDFRQELIEYFERAKALTCSAHTPHDLRTAFALHQRYIETGTMKVSEKTDP